MIAVINYLNENIDLLVKCLGDMNKEYGITISESEIMRSDKVIFPGYGEASKAIGKLHLTNLFSFLRLCKKPMLGIGLGMQLMAELSREGGNIPCLGIFPIVAEKFDEKEMKIPFTGFHEIEITKQSGLFKDINKKENFYFSNSYFLPLNELTTSVAENKIKFSASIEKGNYYAVQFHPEKSGDAGLKVLKNFIEL
jgi:imidazole glycerol-phosphate synthase subunit HisH